MNDVLFYVREQLEKVLGDYMIFFFKLNIDGNKLEYIDTQHKMDPQKNYSVSYLIEKKVPEILNSTFSQSKIINGQYSQYTLQTPNSEDVLESDEYMIFHDSIDRLLESYEKICYTFKQKGDVIYSKKYLNETWVNAKSAKDKFLKKYPDLYSAEWKVKDSSVSENIIPVIGKGSRFIMVFRKIRLLLKENSLENKSFYFYYDSKNELIFIETDSDHVALEYSNQLQNILRESEDVINELGNVTINPIYSEFEIRGEIKNLELVVSYPNFRRDYQPNNNDPLSDIAYNIKDSFKIYFKNSKDRLSKIKDSTLNKLIKPLAERGHLEEVKTAKKNISINISSEKSFDNILKQDSDND